MYTMQEYVLSLIFVDIFKWFRWFRLVLFVIHTGCFSSCNETVIVLNQGGLKIFLKLINQS